MERKVIIAPSLLASDPLNLKGELDELKRAGVTYLHVDIMDGIFVPNLSFGPGLVSALKPYGFVLDVHLMVAEPVRYLEQFVKAGADILTVHLECLAEPLDYIARLRNDYPGVKVGVSIKPKTPLTAVWPVLAAVDLLLIMSVEPGYGGQPFMPEALGRIKEARDYIDRNRLDAVIEVDGGVNVATAPACRAAGADILVAGTAVFKSPDMGAAVRTLSGETK